MLACFGNQRRPIKITSNDDINMIQKVIRNSYGLKENDLCAYQIQYYDSQYEKFVDLYSNSLPDFRELLKRLSSSDAPPKSTKDWLLKIIERSTPSRRKFPRRDLVSYLYFLSLPKGCSISKTATDDTYGFQLEDDTTDLPAIEKVLPIKSSRSDEPGLAEDRREINSNFSFSRH